VENDRTVFRPSHKTLKIDETDFHILTASTTTEQFFHLENRKTCPNNRSHRRWPPESSDVQEVNEMASLVDLTIIIPNYNTREMLQRCLASINAHTSGITFEIICIDDNSSDGSADMVAAEFPFVKLVRNTVGLMYAKNNNLGLKMSSGRYACLLNSDTIISANAFRALVAFMDMHLDAAACTPKILNPDGTVQSSVRRFPGLGVLILQGLNWHKLFPDGKVGRAYYASNLDHNKTQVIEAVGSTALVLRRSTWENAGLLDERFPLYQVDLAYCYMLLKAGYHLYYTPSAEIIHYGGQSANQMPRKMLRLTHKGFHDFNLYYDYFGKSRLIKALVSFAILVRYWLKVCEFCVGRDKRVIKGPGRSESSNAATFDRTRSAKDN
jgi:GT2 family glycosyltransferase